MALCTHLLYLHGFRSSPKSVKAQKMAALVQAEHPDVLWWCPQLPASPQKAMDMVLAGVSDWPKERMAVIGSSLGGFYAACLAHQLGCPAVLLNPAVYPSRDLARHIGEHAAWHAPEEKIFFDAAHVQELALMEKKAQETVQERWHEQFQQTNQKNAPGNGQGNGHGPIAPPAQRQVQGPAPRTWALIAKGDEVLDWREMLARHQAGQVRLIEGSDHALSDFEQYLPEMREFLRLA